MNLFSYTLLFGTVFLLTLKELTEACSCRISHPQEQFCRADVVIHAKVISKTVIKGEKMYDQTVRYGIKMIKMFKGFEKIKNIDCLYTNAESSMCGSYLDVAKQMEYLLTGHVYGKQVTIHLCDLSIPWKDVTVSQMMGIRGIYQIACQCQISYCYGEFCKAPTPNECRLDFHQGLDSDNSQDYACVEWKDGYCIWCSMLPVMQKPFEVHP